MQLILYTLLVILSFTTLFIRDSKSDLWNLSKTHWVAEKKYLYETIHTEITKSSFDQIHVRRKRPSKPTTPRPRHRRPHSIEFNTKRPPSNAKINLILIDQQMSKEEVFASLKTLFYTVYEPAIPSYLLDEVLFKLEELSDEIIFFCYPDELAGLDFEDPQLQELFYTMLKGSSDYPSLLNFVSIDADAPDSLNLMFAPKAVLNCFFSNPTVVDLILETRDSFFETLEKTTLTKQEVEQAFYETVSIHLGNDLDQKQIRQKYDFSLGIPGNMLVVENEYQTLFYKVPFLM